MARWERWQKELWLKADVGPGAPFEDLKFGCFRCGAVLFTGEHILRLGDPGSSGTTDCVWTNCLPPGVEENEPLSFNRKKNADVQSVKCKQCARGPNPPRGGFASVGSFYPNLEDYNLQIDGAACKMTHVRTNKSSQEQRSMVVLGDRDNAMRVIKMCKDYDPTARPAAVEEADEPQLGGADELARMMEQMAGPAGSSLSQPKAPVETSLSQPVPKMPEKPPGAKKSHSDAPPPVKLPDKEDCASQGPAVREACRYGTMCYRESAHHKQRWSHPGDVDWRAHDTL